MISTLGDIHKIDTWNTKEPITESITKGVSEFQDPRII